jgi:hypothetical protein
MDTLDFFSEMSVRFFQNKGHYVPQGIAFAVITSNLKYNVI